MRKLYFIIAIIALLHASRYTIADSNDRWEREDSSIRNLLKAIREKVESYYQTAGSNSNHELEFEDSLHTLGSEIPSTMKNPNLDESPMMNLAVQPMGMNGHSGMNIDTIQVPRPTIENPVASPSIDGERSEIAQNNIQEEKPIETQIEKTVDFSSQVVPEEPLNQELQMEAQPTGNMEINDALNVEELTIQNNDRGNVNNTTRTEVVNSTNRRRSDTPVFPRSFSSQIDFEQKRSYSWDFFLDSDRGMYRVDSYGVPASQRKNGDDPLFVFIYSYHESVLYSFFPNPESDAYICRIVSTPKFKNFPSIENTGVLNLMSYVGEIRSDRHGLLDYWSLDIGGFFSIDLMISQKTGLPAQMGVSSDLIYFESFSDENPSPSRWEFPRHETCELGTISEEAKQHLPSFLRNQLRL